MEFSVSWFSREALYFLKVPGKRKLRIYNFFLKPETDPKNKEMYPKKEETDQQTENLKLFLKTGNGPKKRGNRSTN